MQTHTHNLTRQANHLIPCVTHWRFPTTMAYLYYISCWRYTILVGNPQHEPFAQPVKAVIQRLTFLHVLRQAPFALLTTAVLVDLTLQVAQLDLARGQLHVELPWGADMCHAHLLLVTCTPTALLFVGCLTSQQHASVSQGRICSDNFTCCHTEIEAADQTFHLTQSQYTDTGPTSPSADPIMPGAWQGSHWSANL